MCGTALGASQNDMFAILQRCDRSGKPDAWFGHQRIDPAAGKRSVPPPYDPKGRKGLFQVLSQAEAAPPSSDSWLGHAQVDPCKGKKSCAGPEQRLGRQNLFPVVQQVRQRQPLQMHIAVASTAHRESKRWASTAVQNILRDEERAAKLVRGSDGPLADAWIGNQQIHPAKGKREIGGAACSESSLAGAALRRGVPDTDFGRPGRGSVDPAQTAGHSQHSSVQQLHAGHAAGDDWDVKSRRHFACVPRKCPPGATKRCDLSDVLHGDPVDAGEAARNSRRWAEDSAVVGRQTARGQSAGAEPFTPDTNPFVDSPPSYVLLALHCGAQDHC